MRHVVLAAPFISENTRRVLSALLDTPDLKLSIISCEPPARFPRAERLVGVQQVRAILDPEALVAAARQLTAEHGPIHRLIGFLEQLQLPLAQVRDALDIQGMRTETARNFRDKNRMKRVLRDAGVPVARQALIRQADDARRFADEVGYPLILKPVDGLGSRGTVRVADPDALYVALNRLLPSDRHPLQAEEFIHGEEHSFETACVDGRPVWHSSTAYLPGPLKVLENPWMQYCVLLPKERSGPHVETMRPHNIEALRALGMGTGLSHLEWFLRPDGQPVVSEVGSRPPGVHIMSMIGHAHGVDFWARWTRLMVNDTFAMPPRSHAVGAAFLRGQGRGRVIRAVRGLAEAQERVEGMVVQRQLPQVGQAASGGYEGEGYVMVRAPRTDQVVTALRELVTRIRIDLG